MSTSRRDGGDRHGRMVVGSNAAFVDMASLPDGRLVVATERELLAFLPGGHPDLGFGNAGAVEPLSPEGGKMLIEDIAVDGQGRIVVVGRAEHFGATTNVGSTSYAMIERYLPDGKLDDAFGSNGIVFSDLGLPPPTRPAGVPDYAQVSLAVEVGVVGVAVDSHERPVLTGTRAATYVGIKGATFLPIPDSKPPSPSDGQSKRW